MRPVICMITDRARPAVGGADALVALVSAAAHAGVDLIQIRERDLDGGPLAQLVARCVRAVAGSRTRVLVNDRLDVARASGAHGVHLRSDSFPPSRVRDVTQAGFLIGRSIHSADEARRAADEGSDYLLFGTVFATGSKPGHAAAGVGVLAEAVKATTLPVLAVGGITAENVADVADSGAAGIAAIGWFADARPELLGDVVDCTRRAFDRPRA
jgi:thiamine-phosphate diphosphorylase